ncbi:hypothetical protein Mth01_16830 [Sphaerimonospora thailandensis]|uniref:Uncharacterized protein n=2 Tax=Sphaerimonospora thailandensis TaxID=795644 RepID=A0A8J3R6U3_9ACTN|nr:hypothetical protein Mth01_16830 [Sphaerimonospora thailandensis]
MEVFAAAGVISGGLGLLTLLGHGGRRAWRMLGQTEEFLGDWRGTPARDGVEARPGVMARLAALEESQAVIEHEVVTNDGSSLKDAVKRIETKLTAHLESLED